MGLLNRTFDTTTQPYVEAVRDTYRLFPICERLRGVSFNWMGYFTSVEKFVRKCTPFIDVCSEVFSDVTFENYTRYSRRKKPLFSTDSLDYIFNNHVYRGQIDILTYRAVSQNKDVGFTIECILPLHNPHAHTRITPGQNLVSRETAQQYLLLTQQFPLSIKTMKDTQLKVRSADESSIELPRPDAFAKKQRQLKEAIKNAKK